MMYSPIDSRLDPSNTVLYVVQIGLHNESDVRRRTVTAMKAWGSVIASIVFALCLGTAWGCGPRNSAQLPLGTLPPELHIPEPSQATLLNADSPPSADCGLFPDQGGSVEPIATVGLTERVDPA